MLLASFEAFFCFYLLFLPEEKQVGIINRNKLSFSLVSSLLHLEENHEPIVYKPHCVQVLILRAFHINILLVVLVKFEKAPGKYPGLLQ